MEMKIERGMLFVADKFWPRTEGRNRAFFTLEWFATGEKRNHRFVVHTDKKERPSENQGPFVDVARYNRVADESIENEPYRLKRIMRHDKLLMEEVSNAPGKPTAANEPNEGENA